jgi:hypothetical protein
MRKHTFFLPNIGIIACPWHYIVSTNHTVAAISRDEHSDISQYLLHSTDCNGILNPKTCFTLFEIVQLKL